MIFKEKGIILKNGKECILRSPEISDAGKLLEYIRLTALETDFLTRYPEEINMTLSDEENFLKSINENHNSIMIAAFIENKLVGNASIIGIMDKKKLKHRASLGIAIIKEAWNLGIGSAILPEILNCAKIAGYEQVELEVISQNIRAINLYMQYDFEIYGKREHGFKLKDGTYYSEYLMMKKL